MYEQKELQKDADYFMRSPKTMMKYLDGEIELDKGLFKITDIDFETKALPTKLPTKIATGYIK